ncbi:hypothetical protein H5410_020166 [Solanum commersonii]|uniref:Diphthine--ammonia ligase n=1 Tax=Solanum commersonii TaxID=4109 RepID=A0A9J5Z9C3_SOLCO|nr:hypothetical protein H5410_020166 [Solanum commersonii]
MKVVALVSGGKDSCYAMMKCIQYGHEIVALANLIPADDATDELDSYMYQTTVVTCEKINVMIVGLVRRRHPQRENVVEVPILRWMCGSYMLDKKYMIAFNRGHHDLSYSMTPGDEVEDMFLLLKEVKDRYPLLQQYLLVQLHPTTRDYEWKVYVQVFFFSFVPPLPWQIRNGIIAIAVKVAAIGLNPSKHLGKEMAYLEPHLHKLKELYGINVCGEGGEYETLTLDCPLFKASIPSFSPFGWSA